MISLKDYIWYEDFKVMDNVRNKGGFESGCKVRDKIRFKVGDTVGDKVWWNIKRYLK